MAMPERRRKRKHRRHPKPKPKPKPPPKGKKPPPKPKPVTGGAAGGGGQFGEGSFAADSGAPEAPPGGDMTGTSAINALYAESFYGTGPGSAPQYRRQGDVQQVQAQMVSDQSEATGGPG